MEPLPAPGSRHSSLGRAAWLLPLRHGGQQRQARRVRAPALERPHLRLLHDLGDRAALRGHVASGAGLFSAPEVRHRRPHRARHLPCRGRGNVYRSHPHEVGQKAQAEGFLTCVLEPSFLRFLSSPRVYPVFLSPLRLRLCGLLPSLSLFLSLSLSHLTVAPCQLLSAQIASACSAWCSQI